MTVPLPAWLLAAPCLQCGAITREIRSVWLWAWVPGRPVVQWALLRILAPAAYLTSCTQSPAVRRSQPPVRAQLTLHDLLVNDVIVQSIDFGEIATIATERGNFSY